MTSSGLTADAGDGGGNRFGRFVRAVCMIGGRAVVLPRRGPRSLFKPESPWFRVCGCGLSVAAPRRPGDVASPSPRAARPVPSRPSSVAGLSTLNLTWLIRRGWGMAPFRPSAATGCKRARSRGRGEERGSRGEGKVRGRWMCERQIRRALVPPRRYLTADFIFPAFRAGRDGFPSVPRGPRRASPSVSPRVIPPCHAPPVHAFTSTEPSARPCRTATNSRRR